MPGKTGILLRKLLKVSMALATSLLLSGCNIGCWFVPCDLALEVTARVTAPSGAPLRGAHVDVLGNAGETDENGCVELQGVTHTHKLELHATAPEYKPYDQQKPYNLYEVDIVLQPVTSAKSSSGTWKTQSSQGGLLQCSKVTRYKS
jgi:hypothetical protein